MMSTFTPSYPIAAPSTPGPVDTSLSRRNAVAISMSPFTFQQQAQRFAGQAWALTVTLPKMTREQAAEWAAFFGLLDGRFGTFRYRGPGGLTPRGSAAGTPVVDGADQTGNQLATRGWTNSASGVLLKGDFFQLGTSLHQVLEDVDADGSGEAAIKIWPRLRSVPDDGASLVTTSPMGTWRMESNELGEALDAALHYGFAFTAMEAL